MRKGLRFLAVFLAAFIFSLTNAFAQNITITGNVKHATTHEGVSAVSVTVKDGPEGTFTDANGDFKLDVKKLPVTLVFSSIGFEIKEVIVTSIMEPVQVDLKSSSSLGEEVVVSATRSAQRILDAPVTVERMNANTLRNIPGPSYYESIANLKGVDMHTASLTFRTVTTRGFMSSGNTRLNQLIDGMDNQAPGLNFSVGSVVGLTELDVDNIELLSGASSALYGSGGMNGTLLINSKNPFKYQGLSFNIKQGIMHINDPGGTKPSAYYDWSMRWAKAITKKLAFKIAGQMIKAKDWEAYDYSNLNRNNVISKVIPGNRSTDPNYDGINVYGDQVSQNMSFIANAVQAQIRAGIQGAAGIDIVSTMNAALPNVPTAAQLTTFLGGFPAALRPTIQQLIPFYFGLRNNWYPSTQNVSRTGYEERNLVDYNTLNFKFTGGLNYMITPGIEASFNTYFGTGTTVYTGADRYSLRNLKIAQHKLEVKANHWFVRAYTTQENAGGSYNATALASLINESWKPSTTWFPEYVGNYAGYMLSVAQNGLPPDMTNAHAYARSVADVGRLLPGTAAFNTTASALKGRPIPQGGLFLDRTDLWASEAQLNISDIAGFSKTVEVLAGAQWKQYVLNSKGTLFIDTAGVIKIAETGGYVQLRKKLFQEILTITLSGRYDKHTNFDGRFTPRASAVIRVAPKNNIRLSYQTAYRFPTNQDQYINLNTGTSYLVPMFPDILAKLYPGPYYTAASIAAYRAGGNPANTSLLVVTAPGDVKPETVQSYEIGYKGVLGTRLYVDAYYYYSKYNNFLGRVAVGLSLTGSPTGVFNPSSASTRNISYIENTNQEIKSDGWGVSVDFNLPRNFVLYGNVFSDRLRDVPEGFITFFNAPKYRFNIGLKNESLYKNVGFNFVVKYQDQNYYEGTFVTGTLPSYTWVDGQITYKMPKTKSTVKIGGTNLGNNYQRQGYGSPNIGALYYVSYGYNL
jgi:outer membrane receptor protein involved in Fe transport